MILIVFDISFSIFDLYILLLPFIANYEMQLCFKSDISYEEIVSNLKSLAECLKTEEDEEGTLSLLLCVFLFVSLSLPIQLLGTIRIH